MVFYVRSRRGWEELIAFAGKPPSPVWVDRDILTEQEMVDHRNAGVDLTTFTVKPVEEPDLTTIQMHHPNDVIWVETK